MAGGGDSTRAILFALGANFAIVVAKGVAAFITGSSAMLAEAVHSLADCGNQGLLLLGMKRAKRPPSPDYPLGYGKAIYFWSFLVALMLFSVGGMFSLYEGWHKLHAPGAADPAVDRGRRAGVRHRRRGGLDARLPDRGQQGARRAIALAVVPRQPPGRAGGDLRRRPGRAARPGVRAARGGARRWSPATRSTTPSAPC